MDFFEYSSAALTFSPNDLLIPLIVGALCFVLVFIFEAVGLYTIATNNGYKNKWMAFVPFFNTYYIGVCAQKNKFYNMNAKTIGLVVAILEVVLSVLYILLFVSVVLLENYLVRVENDVMITYSVGSIPSSLNWAAWIYKYLETYIISIIELVYLVFQALLLVCFFQTYACRRYVLFALTSVLFPIMGILFFVVRNNKAVNYKEFIMAEQARQYQMYQQYRQQNYNNPYNNNQDYNRNPYSRDQQNNPPRDPFDGEYGQSNNNPPEDPFDDFDKK